MRAYLDSDILIWHLRGENRAQGLMRRLVSEGSELWLGAAQRIEVVFFMRPEEERATQAFLSRFKTQPLTQEIVDKGGELYRRWHPSHGIDVNDALLAATVGITGGTLYTLNRKHYPMHHLNVVKGW